MYLSLSKKHVCTFQPRKSQEQELSGKAASEAEVMHSEGGTALEERLLFTQSLTQKKQKQKNNCEMETNRSGSSWQQDA